MSNKRKRQPQIFSDPLTARFLSQTSRSVRYSIFLTNLTSIIRSSLLRLAFNDIFAGWGPAENPKAINLFKGLNETKNRLMKFALRKSRSERKELRTV